MPALLNKKNLLSKDQAIITLSSPRQETQQADINIMKIGKLCHLHCTALCSILFLMPFASSKNHVISMSDLDKVLSVLGNAANDVVDIINKNRTSQKLPTVITSAGLGCIALQYAAQCKGNCTGNNTIQCQPPEDDFTEVFAPNCGVELPTFGTISGYIIGCHHKYLQPQEAFSSTLIADQKAIHLLGNKTFNEVGVGIIGRPYVWCVLFSDGRVNSTFVLEELGRGIQQKKGCYSGIDIPCSQGCKNSAGLVIILLVLLIFSVVFM